MFKKYIVAFIGMALSFSSVAASSLAKPNRASSAGYAFAGAQAGTVLFYGFNVAQDDTLFGNYMASDGKSQASYAGRVFGGYMFNPYIGVELGASTFGVQNVAAYDLGSTGKSAKNMPANYQVRRNIGIDGSLVTRPAITDSVFIIGKLGVATIRYQFTSPNGSVAVNSGSNLREAIRAELGLGYKLTDSLWLTASYAHYISLDFHLLTWAIERDLPGQGADFAGFDKDFGVMLAGLTYQF